MAAARRAARAAARAAADDGTDAAVHDAASVSVDDGSAATDPDAIERPTDVPADAAAALRPPTISKAERRRQGSDGANQGAS